MSDKPKPVPPQPAQPPVGQEPPALGEDVPQNATLRRQRVIRGGVGAIPAVWEDE